MKILKAFPKEATFAESIIEEVNSFIQNRHGKIENMVIDEKHYEWLKVVLVMNTRAFIEKINKEKNK